MDFENVLITVAVSCGPRDKHPCTAFNDKSAHLLPDSSTGLFS
jgi:hypothetical protein